MSLNIGDNFSYLGKKFLDNRQSFDTLELMNNCSDVPIGFITFCKEVNKRYEYTESGWVEYSTSISNEQVEKINAAYIHSQTQHVQPSDLEGFATEEFVTNKIAEAELGGEEVDLSGYATKEYVDEAISNIDISGGGNVDIDLSNYVTNDKLQEGLANKFDNVEVNEAQTNDNQTALDFYANGEVVKTIYFSGGGGNASIPPYISTILPENSILGLGGVFDLQLDFSSSVTGRGTVKIFVNDVESISMSIPQGENTIPMADTYFTKGNNRVTVYVVDRTGQMSNSLTFYVRYGSLEIASDFDAYTAYEPGAVVRYYFTPTAVDTSLALTMYMKIDGEVKDGVSCSSDTRGYFTFPNNLEVGAHFCQAYVVDSAGSTSNVLSFNLIVLDAVSLVVASDTVNPIVEEGEQLSLDYKVYMRGATSFITKTYIDENLVNTGTCGLDFAYYRTNTLTEGIHTIKMEVYDVTETVSDYIIWTVTVTPSTYEMLQPVKAGSLFIGTAQNMTNSSENKEVWRGTDQDGAIVDGILHNFAFNSESGWVDDELLISGASSVEIPITPLANNARYGFTLDIEFASKMIGVDDALVLNLWDDEKDCGIKITTEQVILRSAEGNQADLYFTDSEMTSVMFVIDRNEATAKIYLNGVMCSAFHLSDYSIDGVPYLEDFTVNNTIMLGGSGHARIKNLRVYQVALSTDEILNNFMANETRKAEQKALVEFQKGDHLPTLTIYCDFSGLGKDDKKPCAITYVSTDEEKYGKSFTLTHKKSTCQYQGTSSMAYPIKNYRINLADEEGNKWKYEFPFGKPEHRYTLKADFMSSGHWTNTGLTKWINNNLYNYDLDDEKTMNPKKWYDINNGGSIDDTRECIYGFPCRLILVNDGKTPLNEGQNEPTPGNTKDMGIFNFNHDKDATDTMGFDDDVFPNCASYEVTANSDTSAGAFMKYKGVLGNFAVGGICETPVGYVGGAYYTPLFPVEMFDGVSTVKHAIWTACSIGVDANFNEITNIQGQNPLLSDVIVQGVKYVRFKYYNDPHTTIGNVTIKATEVLEEVMPNFMVEFYVESDLDELDYIKQSFELRFPDEDDVPEGWGFMGVPDEEGTGLKALIDWVDGCTDEEFVRDFDQHFHRDYTLRYFLLVITLGMVDNLGKNMMLDTWDNKIFMPRFYDCDTICSYDNSGQLKFDVDIEMTQGYWNTSSSRLWTRIRDLMHDELVAKYNNMRQNGLSYESLMECFYDEQIAKIPQRYYNMDYDVKYGPFADSYIGMANGDVYEHVKRWLQQRLRFVDTLYDYAPSYNNDVLTIRANTTEPMTLEIETYTPVYQHLSWYNNQMDKKKIDGKTSVSFTGTAMAATDQEVLIYGGSNIKSIKGISSMNPNRMLIGSATRLIELDAPNCPLLADINANKANLAPHIYLNKVNLSGCPLLGGNLIVNQSPLVREIDIRGTAITGLNLPPSLRNLEVLKLPAAISNLVLNDAGQLHTLEFEEGGTLQSVSMTNCNALTNITNFNLEDATSITLNNSYNTVNELYLSKATNLSVSNMANLERVVYTPNAEHEVFDKANVDNAPNYTISTFNCPKLSTFMTTAPFRNSYNIYKDEEVIDTTKTIDILPKDYVEGYIHYESGEVVEQSGGPNIVFNQYVEVIEGLSYALEGECDTVRIAFYDDTNKFVKYIDTNTPNTFVVPTGVSYVRAMFVNYKTPIEQYKILSYGFTTIQVKDYGETLKINYWLFEGKKFTSVMKNINALNNKVTVETQDGGKFSLIYFNDTAWCGNADVLFSSGATVSILSNNNTHFAIQDSSLNSEYIKINGKIYYYNIQIAQDGYDEPFALRTNYKPNEVFEANILDISSTQFKDVKLLCTTDTNKLLLPRTVKNLVVDSAYDLDTAYLTHGDYDTIHTDLYEPYNTDYESNVIPTNIIPSASDGSLIFSMYAPHNTTEPASGTWDMKGLDFDTFHTFGLNNDIIQAEDGSITMPNRLDGYSNNIDNLRLPNEIANYTASDANTFPTFNAEFKYSYVVSVLDGSYVYRILADDMDNLPTSISFRAKSHLLSVEYLNIDNLEYTNQMFFNCTSLTYVNVSDWDTTNINNLASMFYGCSNLNNIDVSNWDTTKVTNMNHMFYNCSSLTALDVSNWDTSKVTNMNNIFRGCEVLTSLDVSNWDTKNVSDMAGMFYDCYYITSLDLSNFDTSKVTNMNAMFNGCNKLTSLVLSNFDTSKVINMGWMFRNCSNLTSLDLSNFDTSNVTEMQYMFQNCNSLQELHLESWSLNTVTQTAVSSLPIGDDAKNILYTAVYFTVPSGWTQDNALEIIRYTANASGVKPDLKTFTAYSLSETDNGDGTYTVQIGVDSLDILPTSISFYNKTNLLTVEKMNTSKLTNMASMFQLCSNLIYVNTSNWDTSMVTNMSHMFNGCSKLTTLDVSNWDTSNVTNASNMFQACGKLTSLDVSDWITSKVTNMSYMFHSCASLTTLDVSDWNTSKVTSMACMFYSCVALTSLDVSNWDTGEVTDMYIMFGNCPSLTSLDLSNFDINKVTSMSSMFSSCASLQELHIESWPLNNVTQTAVSSLPVGNDAKNDIYASANFTIPSGWTLINATAKTMIMSQNDLANLTDEEIAALINDGWTIG